ncbi:MAG: sulfatase-like hydrolase/transferase [Bacteroidales bacterium]|nr:sulfatase-like hydrolase/transferase [Bacteroidales bacterium]
MFKKSNNIILLLSIAIWTQAATIVNNDFNRDVIPDGWSDVNNTGRLKVVNKELRFEYTRNKKTVGAKKMLNKPSDEYQLNFDIKVSRNYLDVPVYVLDENGNQISRFIFGNNEGKGVFMATKQNADKSYTLKNILTNGTIKTNEYYSISIHINTIKNTQSLYVNGKTVPGTENIPLLSNGKKVVSFHVDQNYMYNNGFIYIDNFKMELVEIDKTLLELNLANATKIGIYVDKDVLCPGAVGAYNAVIAAKKSAQSVFDNKKATEAEVGTASANLSAVIQKYYAKAMVCSKNKNLPNIIYILADDLGYGDLSCYGQKKFSTTNIDKLAEKGIRFTQHYAGAPVCAPSRSVLMTGQDAGINVIRGNSVRPYAPNVYLMSEMFKNAGYTTGQFGKWGLGNSGSISYPNDRGWDDFYGYANHSLAHRYYPAYLDDNSKIDSLKGNDWKNTETYAADEIHKRALQFIDNNKDNPFFIYYPTIIPHAELIVPEDDIIQSFRGKFKEVPFYDKSKGDYGSANFKIGAYCSQREPRATYASMITRLDIYVGEIIDKLKEHGIYENTIVIFTSDHGPHREGGHNPKFFNSTGGFRGNKRDLYEGGLRVPFIVHWPKVIKSKFESNHISMFQDMMPTFGEILDLDAKLETTGKSLLPTIKNSGTQETHEYLYWEFGEQNGKQAVRKGKWKAVKLNVKTNPNGPIELYNLDTDPYETNNVAASNPSTVRQMKEIMRSHRTEDSKYWLLPYNYVSTLKAYRKNPTHLLCDAAFSNWGKEEFVEVGLCYAEKSNPTINDNVITLSTIQANATFGVSDVKENTRYYFRAYAKTADQTIYAEQRSIKSATLKSGSITNTFADNNKVSIVISPNPARDFITFETDFAMEKVTIYDIYGRIHQAYEYPNFTLDISDLGIGNYIVKIESQGEIFIKRLVKQ